MSETRYADSLDFDFWLLKDLVAYTLDGKFWYSIGETVRIVSVGDQGKLLTHTSPDHMGVMAVRIRDIRGFRFSCENSP